MLDYSRKGELNLVITSLDPISFKENVISSRSIEWIKLPFFTSEESISLFKKFNSGDFKLSNNMISTINFCCGHPRSLFSLFLAFQSNPNCYNETKLELLQSAVDNFPSNSN